MTCLPFVFILRAPQGAWRARFELEPGRCYGPDDVRVEAGTGGGPCPHTLTVEAAALPSEAEFRVLAARAATRSADDTADPLRRWLNVLIPF